MAIPQFINIHTHHFSKNENILEIVNQYPNQFDASITNFSVGIHTWFINENRVESDLQLIEEKLKFKDCMALGECGLDKRIEIPLNLQIEVFEKQLLLANEYHKPVILHCVAAFQEIIAIKKRLKMEVPMIIHGFSKNQQIAKQLLEAGFYLSFGQNLLQKEALKLVFKNIPNNRFFLETDNSSISIEEMYTFAAKLKNINTEKFQLNMQNNFNSVFKFKI
jgi:TatD DNase family protein